MRRSLLTLFALVAAGAALCFAAYRAADFLSARHLSRTADDLDWLRLEFRLSDAEMARIRQAHEGYLPVCRGFCDRIAARQRELHTALGGGTNVTTSVESNLNEIALLRAQCQAAMLRHFVEVSRLMPPKQGKRYLAEMQRLTLGFHEEIEHRMSGDTPSPHGHP